MQNKKRLRKDTICRNTVEQKYWRIQRLKRLKKPNISMSILQKVTLITFVARINIGKLLMGALCLQESLL